VSYFRLIITGRQIWKSEV